MTYLPPSKCTEKPGLEQLSPLLARCAVPSEPPPFRTFPQFIFKTLNLLLVTSCLWAPGMGSLSPGSSW